MDNAELTPYFAMSFSPEEQNSMNKATQRLILIGCGGTAEMMADCFESSGAYEVVAFAVEKRYLQPSFMGRPVVSYEDMERKFHKKEYKFFVAIGETDLNRLRFRFYSDLVARGWTPASFIAASAQISARAKLGPHCFIGENTVIQAHCVVGANVIALPHCYIAHHAHIGDNVFAAGGAVISGFASLGNFSFVGANASVSNCISLAADCVVGIGCSCSHDLSENEAILTPHGAIKKNAREIFRLWHNKVAAKAKTRMGTAENKDAATEIEADKPGNASNTPSDVWSCGARAAATLFEQMALTPRYRQNGLWPDTRHVVICADVHSVGKACEEVAAHCPNVSIEGVCLHKGHTDHINAIVHGRMEQIPVITPTRLKDMPHCSAVLYWSGSIVPDLLYHTATVIPQTMSVSVFPRIPLGVGRKRDATFYERKKHELESIYKNLGDDESRLCFAGVVKGLVTGEIEWLRPPVCGEYQYPVAAATPGDIVLDAGLFDSTILRRFALRVGQRGHVYGFEPEPDNFAFVQRTLREFGDPGNVSLVDKGLYSSCGVMNISAEGASGSLSTTAGDNSSPCQVITVDRFAEVSSLPHIDLIKMDIEGSELDALKGAQDSIRRWKPKLHICAYHHIDDLVDIPVLINDISPGYCFYFSSHVPYLNEYVYYAVASS